MAGVFKLISADVYEVLACEKLDDVPDAADDAAPEPEVLPDVR